MPYVPDTHKFNYLQILIFKDHYGNTPLSPAKGKIGTGRDGKRKDRPVGRYDARDPQR